MVGRVVFLACLFPAAFAFSNTAPLVAWASHSTDVLDSLASTASDSSSLLEALLTNGDICSHDAIVLVNQPSLHASDLRALPSNSAVTQLLGSAASSRQYPYIPTVSSSLLQDLATAVSQRCQSRLVNVVSSSNKKEYDTNHKHVICMTMPHLGNDEGGRLDALAKNDALISHEINTISTAFPKHLIILTGSSSSLSKRDTTSSFSQSDYNNASTGGILKRYQLLTPALISSLLVTFFVLIPIVLIGVSALSSIQSPLRMEAPKGYDAQERKNK